MTASAFGTATTWSYGLAVVGYLVFGTRVAIGSRGNARARLLIGAMVLTAVWAGFCLMFVFAPSRAAFLGANIADALRFGVWYAFMAHLSGRLGADSRPFSAGRASTISVVIVALIASVLFGEAFAFASTIGPWGVRIGYLIRLGLSVFGLMLVEQVVRCVQPQMRWAIKPLAIALAGVFGLELFFYADAMLFGQLDPDIWVARGLANVIVIPFLAVATARNTGWTVDLHLSRQAVFHSSALLVSGAFLLAVAIAGYFVRYFGGDWGRALQIELLFAATLVVALVASSGRFRSRLKVFISKHFFSYRYDYRLEWLKFTRTLSTESAVQSLEERTIMALANLVESPAGALWLKDDLRGYVPAARWNTPALDLTVRVDDPFPQFLARTGWIIGVDGLRSNSGEYDGLAVPGWLDTLQSPWIVIPLASGTGLQGFVVLSSPRTAIDVDWEVRDLLKTASWQAASYLGQVQATEALLEARKFDAFNRMSAFVVHDLKNLIAQLSLMLKNATRHHGNPEFQADMLATVEHVVNRMNSLMLQLRVGKEPVDRPLHVDLAAVVRRVCAGKADTRVIIDGDSVEPVVAVGHDDRLEHVIGHLLQNAIDASPPGGRVAVRVEREARFAIVEVSDKGIGMSEEFVRERLFKPFQTTKAAGMGIGVYESSQYVSGLGGAILIDSKEDVGTTVRVRLPLAETTTAETARVSKEAA